MGDRFAGARTFRGSTGTGLVGGMHRCNGLCGDGTHADVLYRTIGYDADTPRLAADVAMALREASGEELLDLAPAELPETSTPDGRTAWPWLIRFRFVDPRWVALYDGVAV
jgi:hypothetical protein